MFNFSKSLAISFTWLAFAYASPASAQSRAWEFLENNNHVIKAQREGGSATAAGDVTLDFFGHMAFRITSPKGTTIVIDPWRNDPSGAWGSWFPKDFPEIPADMVLSTHAHFDHDAVHRVHAAATLERLAGTLSIGDVTVTGLADKHQCRAPGWYKWTDVGAEFGQDFCASSNAMHMDNVIQVVSTGGLRIAHWGDNRPEPAPHVMEALKGVDVLILPIDESHHILSEEQIQKIVKIIQPKVVIPAHYYTKGASSVLTTLGNADRWVSKQSNPVMLNSSRLVLNAGSVKDMRERTHYFGYNFATK
jgi:L-ascorbate metabolism protein UlaG (beta-lactamase superfamily)